MREHEVDPADLRKHDFRKGITTQSISYVGWVDRLAMEPRDTMNSLPERIMEYAEMKPESTPVRADDMLHLGDRAAVAWALSHLARSDRLLRICRGVYMRPIQTRFGLRAPRLEKALASLSALWDEVIVPNGGGAANWLGLTTQNPVRSVYLPSGPSRCLHFGGPRSGVASRTGPPVRSSARWCGSAPMRSRTALML